MSGIKGTYLYSALNNKCPRCRKGDMFCSTNAYNLKEFTKMHETCAVCGQPTEIEYNILCNLYFYFDLPSWSFLEY